MRIGRSDHKRTAGTHRRLHLCLSWRFLTCPAEHSCHCLHYFLEFHSTTYLSAPVHFFKCCCTVTKTTTMFCTDDIFRCFALIEDASKHVRCVPDHSRLSWVMTAMLIRYTWEKMGVSSACAQSTSLYIIHALLFKKNFFMDNICCFAFTIVAFYRARDPDIPTPEDKRDAAFLRR